MSAWFEVDLDALDANLASLRARVAPAELMLVVKDDAYNHGIAEVVPRAVTAGIGWIGAFDVPTARAVRQVAGDDLRVFVWMLPEPRDVGEAIDLGLDLGIGDDGALADVASRAETGGADARETVRVHLKVDTGLRRNGFRLEDWDGVVHRARELELTGTTRVVGIWSHIAEASDADDDDARARFDEAVATARQAGLRPEFLHLSASSASHARPEFRYDLARVGAFCYGISPAGGPTADDLGLRPVGTLRATVTAAADDVTVDAGALDGLPSSLGGRFDIHTPDGPRRVTHVGASESTLEAWPSASPGDEVVVFGAGPGPSATQLAETIGTIGEEIVTRLSPRLERRFVPGDDRTRG